MSLSHPFKPTEPAVRALTKVLTEQCSFITREDTPELLADPATRDLDVLLRYQNRREILPLSAAILEIANPARRVLLRDVSFTVQVTDALRWEILGKLD